MKEWRSIWAPFCFESFKDFQKTVVERPLPPNEALLFRLFERNASGSIDMVQNPDEEVVMPFERGPYLSVAAFCEQVIEDKSGVLSLIRIVDRLNFTAQGVSAPAEMPPSNFNWTLVLTLKSGEARGSHEVKIVPELPSGETMPASILSIHLEGGNRGANLISRLSMPLTMPGIYWFKIYVDDEFLTQLPIEVIYSRIVPPSTQS